MKPAGDWGPKRDPLLCAHRAAVWELEILKRICSMAWVTISSLGRMEG